MKKVHNRFYDPLSPKDFVCPRAVIVLNGPHNGPLETSFLQQLFRQKNSSLSSSGSRRDGEELWRYHHPLLIAADGAGLFVLDAFRETDVEYPLFIVGDMDSLPVDAKKRIMSSCYKISAATVGDISLKQLQSAMLHNFTKRYNKLKRREIANGGDSSLSGWDIVTMEIADQDSTDYDKCVEVLKRMLLLQRPLRADSDVVVVLGATGGRLDHSIAALKTLQDHPLMPLVHYDEYNTTLLCPARCRTLIHRNVGWEGAKCGIIPFASSCIGVRSIGLQWNINSCLVTDEETSPPRGEKKPFGFAGFISTSNTFAAAVVEMDLRGSDVPVLFTMGAARLDRDMLPSSL